MSSFYKTAYIYAQISVFFHEIIFWIKSLLQNLGVILVIIGAVILIASYATGNVNNNAVLGVSLLLVVAGLISYIILNKRITD